MLIKNVWKLHELLTTMISDRGPQFASAVWKTWCEILNIKAKLSTAFHSETDGQTENANAGMEQYLRSFINYQQDDWFEWLFMAEFAANGARSASSGLTPFQTNYGFEPRMSFDPITSRPGSARERLQMTKAKDIGETMKNTWEYIKANLERAQVKQVEFANRHREAAPEYKVGDMV